MLDSFYLTHTQNPLILEYMLSFLQQAHPSVSRLENLDQAFDITVFKVFYLFSGTYRAMLTSRHQTQEIENMQILQLRTYLSVLVMGKSKSHYLTANQAF